MQLIEASLDGDPAPSVNPCVSPRIGGLIDEILERYHGPAREQGNRIQPLLDKVARVHGGKEPRLRELWALFQQTHTELLQHMRKEEMVLFPWCRQLETASAWDSEAGPTCGTVAAPIRMMGHEHASTSEQIARIQSLTDDFTPPAWACNSYRALFSELERYVADLEAHMYLENALLFPAALRREQELSTGSTFSQAR